MASIQTSSTSCYHWRCPNKCVLATAAKRVDSSRTARLSVNRCRPLQEASIQTSNDALQQNYKSSWRCPFKVLQQIFKSSWRCPFFMALSILNGVVHFQSHNAHLIMRMAVGLRPFGDPDDACSYANVFRVTCVCVRASRLSTLDAGLVSRLSFLDGGFACVCVCVCACVLACHAGPCRMVDCCRVAYVSQP